MWDRLGVKDTLDRKVSETVGVTDGAKESEL